MMKWLIETFIGIAVMVICWLSYVLHIKFSQLCDEDSKRVEIARFKGKNMQWNILDLYCHLLHCKPDYWVDCPIKSHFV